MTTEHTIQVTIKSTGQIIEFPSSSPADIVASLETVDEMLNVYRSIRLSLYERGIVLMKQQIKGKSDTGGKSESK